MFQQVKDPETQIKDKPWRWNQSWNLIWQISLLLYILCFLSKAWNLPVIKFNGAWAASILENLA